MGGVGSVIAGARSPEEILFGMATGAVVGALNHMTHSVFLGIERKPMITW
jgi:hypothetical protein